MSMLMDLDRRDNSKQLKYRHEYKFMCNEAQWIQMKARIEPLMKPDSNVDEDGCYEIRSIYFDDLYDTCYHKNEAGVDPRAKYRIRAYNCSDQVIKLEKKIKKQGMTHKKTVSLTKEEYDLIMAGAYSDLMRQIVIHPEEEQKKLLLEFVTLGLTRKFSPKVIVSYERYPFIDPAGNVRVTFDKNIASGTDFAGFFEDNPVRCPVLSPGLHLLEIKYDEFLPVYIREIMENGALRQTTFSKYYICRHERIKR